MAPENRATLARAEVVSSEPDREAFNASPEQKEASHSSVNGKVTKATRVSESKKQTRSKKQVAHGSRSDIVRELFLINPASSGSETKVGVVILKCYDS